MEAVQQWIEAPLACVDALFTEHRATGGAFAPQEALDAVFATPELVSCSSVLSSRR